MPQPRAGIATATIDAPEVDEVALADLIPERVKEKADQFGIKQTYASHQFLVDDFVKACVTGEPAPNHVWAAARYCLPGIIAHESAKHEGRPMDVPDLGWPS